MFHPWLNKILPIHALFGVAEEFQHVLGLVHFEEFLPELGRAQKTADAGEQAEVFADVGGDQEEENLGWNPIVCAVRHTGRMTAEDDDGTVHHADEGIPSVRQGDTITDSSGVEILTLLQGAEESLFGSGLAGDAGDMLDQFRQDGVTIGAPELELDGGRGQQVGQKPFGCRSIAHDAERIGSKPKVQSSK